MSVVKAVFPKVVLNVSKEIEHSLGMSQTSLTLGEREPVDKLIVSRLLESFSELERAIQSAKSALGKKAEPAKSLLDRINSYEDILEKQRILASSLCKYVATGDWGEVARHVKIINGLSAMIRDDAREVVAGIRTPLTREEREVILS